MFLDTGHVEDIIKGYESGIFQGVTTNPTLLKKEGKKRDDSIRDIVKCHPKSLFVQIIGRDKSKLWEDYLSLSKLEEEIGYPIGIKVPLDEKGLALVHAIKEHNPKTEILGTAIYSSEQAILGALAGCDYLAPYINRMLDNGIDSYGVIRDIRYFLNDRGLATKILAASFKNTQQVVKALTAGAHTCTISYDIFMKMINKPLGIEAIEVFNQDGESI